MEKVSSLEGKTPFYHVSYCWTVIKTMIFSDYSMTNKCIGFNSFILPPWRANQFTASANARQSVYNAELNVHPLDEGIKKKERKISIN